MPNMSLDWIDHELQKLAGNTLLRQRISRSGKLTTQVVIDGRRYLNFASNDYLGIAADRSLNEIVAKTILQGGWGSGASPLIVGRTVLHAELERRLAEFLDCEAALLFPTGFAANMGTIPALVGKHDLIFSDAKNHASIIDGCRLSGAKVIVYPHVDSQALAELMATHQTTGRRLIVSDSLFSMDGDVAPIEQLVMLANEHNAMLMVDEAHALGVIGANGQGVSADCNVLGKVDIVVGTLSKSLGSHGGFVAGSSKLIDYLANRARSYVFSTAAPVANAAVALAALNVIRDQPKRRERLIELATYLRQQLVSLDWNIGTSEHHIVRVILGQPEDAVSLTTYLRENGFWVPCIRPPTVPPGESCLRISLSSSHSQQMIDALLESLASFRK